MSSRPLHAPIGCWCCGHDCLQPLWSRVLNSDVDPRRCLFGPTLLVMAQRLNGQDSQPGAKGVTLSDTTGESDFGGIHRRAGMLNCATTRRIFALQNAWT